MQTKRHKLGEAAQVLLHRQGPHADLYSKRKKCVLCFALCAGLSKPTMAWGAERLRTQKQLVPRRPAGHTQQLFPRSSCCSTTQYHFSTNPKRKTNPHLQVGRVAQVRPLHGGNFFFLPARKKQKQIHTCRSGA